MLKLPQRCRSRKSPHHRVFKAKGLTSHYWAVFLTTELGLFRECGNVAEFLVVQGFVAKPSICRGQRLTAGLGNAHLFQQWTRVCAVYADMTQCRNRVLADRGFCAESQLERKGSVEGLENIDHCSLGGSTQTFYARLFQFEFFKKQKHEVNKENLPITFKLNTYVKFYVHFDKNKNVHSSHRVPSTGPIIYTGQVGEENTIIPILQIRTLRLRYI